MSLCWQHCDEYLEYRIGLGLSINSTKGYVFDLSRYLKDNYNDKENLIKDMVMPWCVQRESEKSCSFRRRVSAIRQFTVYLYSMGYSNFILNIDFLPKNTRYIPYIFTDEDLLGIFNLAIQRSKEDQNSLKKLIISVIFRLIYFCGLRPNEGREVRIEDVDLIKGTILIRKNKTHKERVIPMADEVTDMVKDYLIKLYKMQKNAVYLFPSKTNDCYKSKWLREEFLKLWNETKNPTNTARIRVYDLRHRWATAVMTKFINEGEDLFNVLPYMSSYMGHSSFEETAYYIHLLPENLLKSKNINWEKMSSIIPEVIKDDE